VWFLIRVRKETAGQVGQSTEDRGSDVPAPASVIPIQGNTQLAAAPVQTPAVPVPTKKILTRTQIMALAEGLNPQHRELKNVRELMLEAAKRNLTRMIP
jgi:hypothetical protein